MKAYTRVYTDATVVVLRQLKSVYTGATKRPLKIIWNLCQYVIKNAGSSVDSIITFTFMHLADTFIQCSTTEPQEQWY